MIDELRKLIATVNVDTIHDYFNDKALFNWCGWFRQEANRILDDIERSMKCQ